MPENEQEWSVGPTRAKLLREGKVSFADLIDKNTGRLRTLQELGFGRSGNILGAGQDKDILPFQAVKGAPDSITNAAKLTNPHYHDGAGYQRNCQRCVPAYALRRRGYDVEALPNPHENSNGTSKRNQFAGFECFKNPLVRGQMGLEVAIGRDELLKSLSCLPERGMAGIMWTKSNSTNGHTIVCEKIGGQLVFVDPQMGIIGNAEILGVCDKRYGYSWYRMDNLEIDREFEWDEIVRFKK